MGGLPLGSGLKVWWKEAEANGAPIVAYTLQAAPFHPASTNGLAGATNITFTTVYNGSGKWRKVDERGVRWS